MASPSYAATPSACSRLLWSMTVALALGSLPACDADDSSPGSANPGGASSGSEPSGPDTLYTTGISASASEADSDATESHSGETDADDDDGPPPDTDPEPGGACDEQTPCEDRDGNPCTVPRCDDGACVEEALDCERDTNACATASCDPESGSCTYTALDSNCGTDEVCSTPRCSVSLDGDGELVEAVCDIEFRDNRSCDDGDACTEADTCTRGTCQGATLSCHSPPEPTCSGSMLQSFGGGSCDAGRCDYATTAVSCPDGCSGGACNGPSHPLISEVLYDDAGTDDNVWIELWGPPGSSLSGIVVEFVNGSSGAVGDTYPLSGTVPADGIVLIVSDAANNPNLLANADFVDGIADLQNGPDNVRLRSGETVLDAVGYGSFDDDETFAGEGSPTSDASPDRSLARQLSVVDTDNNAADFSVETEPTPGAVNP